MRNFLCVMLLCVGLTLQAQIPQRPYPQRLVNDLTGVLTSVQLSQMEQYLIDFDEKTSNQICVVILSDLQGMDILDLAYRIGENWGIGQENFNNGVVVLIKIQNETGGLAAIATGYGLETVLTDAVCRRIIEKDMIPFFKENDYYSGITAALKHICALSAGEYSPSEINDDEDELMAALLVLFVFVFMLVLIILLSKKANNKDPDDKENNQGGGNRQVLDDLAKAIWLSNIGGKRSSGGGSFGGSKGFGGFGGGHFGGGGAKGGW